MEAVWTWFRRKRAAKEQGRGTGLTGAPAVMRVKTYSAETGYVYQYVYRGYRAATQDEGRAGTEFVFQVTRDRRNYFDVKIILLDEAIAACAKQAGRELSNTERYAAAKMTLFGAFDEIQDVAGLEGRLIPEASRIEEKLRILDRL